MIRAFKNRHDDIKIFKTIETPISLFQKSHKFLNYDSGFDKLNKIYKNYTFVISTIHTETYPAKIFKKLEEI